MGKRGARSSAKFESIPKKIEVEKPAEKPDPKSGRFFNDEVDDFHTARDMIPLKNARRSRKESSDEEVYKVAVDSDEDEDENQFEDESDADQADLQDDIRSDIEDEEDGENYLPSADAWGRNKKDFYSTDYVDKDYGGNLSESDEEAAQLEEVEAKSLQKRLAGHVTEEDFAMILPQAKIQSTTSGSSLLLPLGKSHEKVDVSNLNDDEKLAYLEKRNPEFIGLLEDFKEKKKIVEQELKPIVESIANEIVPRTASLNLIQLRYEVYENYLMNVNFYLLLMANQAPMKSHPVIDRIVEWRKIVDVVDEKCEILSSDAKILLETLKSNDSTQIGSLKFIGENIQKETQIVEKFAKKIKKRKLQKNPEVDEFANFENDDEDEVDPKRAATYQILKNKGTTPRRKKEDRNPRVKHRRKFQKALHKKRSQTPDVRKELKKYDGEIRGIKANVIKSVKLH